MCVSSKSLHPFRAYTCYIDGDLHAHAFPHGKLRIPEMEAELNRQFHEWLELEGPHAQDEGRVSGIQFSDDVE